MFNFFQSDLPTGSEVIEVEEDNTISVGGEGYKVVIDNGPQESLEKRKGKLAKTVIHIYPTFYDKLACRALVYKNTWNKRNRKSCLE